MTKRDELYAKYIGVMNINAVLKQQNAERLEALKEIAKTEGPYSRDPLTHAENVIENMASIANKAIAKAEGKT